MAVLSPARRRSRPPGEPTAAESGGGGSPPTAPPAIPCRTRGANAAAGRVSA